MKKRFIAKQAIVTVMAITVAATTGGEMNEWTKATVDETIRLYEDTLERIKNGTKVSKLTDGDSDILMESPPDKEDDGAQWGSRYG